MVQSNVMSVPCRTQFINYENIKFWWFNATAHALADRGLWDENEIKRQENWGSSLSKYTVSSSEFSGEEQSVPHHSTPNIDCVSRESDPRQEASDRESDPDSKNPEDSKVSRNNGDKTKGQHSSCIRNRCRLASKTIFRKANLVWFSLAFLSTILDVHYR